LARARGIEGTAVIRANVRTDGRVSSAVVYRSSGNNSLDNAALSAVKQWVFQPAKRDGQTLASIVQVPVQFRLN
jgi:protein TonB